jgi:hypothetical protein
MRETPSDSVSSAVANGQAEVKPREAGRTITEPAATGRITSETSGRMAEAELGAGAASGRMARPTAGWNRRTKAGTGNRQTDTGSQDAETSTESQRTARQPLPANADITDTQTPEYREAMPTGTEAGTTLADVLRAIASLSETDRELLLQLLQTLRGANT